jgi:hypothetical protein
MQDIRDLLLAARELASDIVAVNVRPAEEGDDEASISTLVEQTSSLLDRGLLILDGVVERWDRAVETENEDNRGPEQQLGDLAAMARMEISRRREQIIDGGGLSVRWTLIGNSSGCRRNLHKALAAVEQSICALDGLQPEIAPLMRIETSLEIRMVYKKFTAQIKKATEQGTADLPARLRSVGNTMAILIGREVYPQIRISDRAALRGLQRRVHDWYAKTDSSDQEGLRLEQDVIAFATLLLEINHRAELVEHDKCVLAECLATLKRLAPGESAFNAIESLRSLWGRHPKLDALIEGDETPATGQWLETVQQLAGTAEEIDPFRSAGRPAWIPTDRRLAAAI